MTDGEKLIRYYNICYVIVIIGYLVMRINHGIISFLGFASAIGGLILAVILIKCPYCKHRLLFVPEYCPHCGKEIK